MATDDLEQLTGNKKESPEWMLLGKLEGIAQYRHGEKKEPEELESMKHAASPHRAAALQEQSMGNRKGIGSRLKPGDSALA